jgi:hypothetical protein
MWLSRGEMAIVGPTNHLNLPHMRTRAQCSLRSNRIVRGQGHTFLLNCGRWSIGRSWQARYLIPYQLALFTSSLSTGEVFQAAALWNRIASRVTALRLQSSLGSGRFAARTTTGD